MHKFIRPVANTLLATWAVYATWGHHPVMYGAVFVCAVLCISESISEVEFQWSMVKFRKELHVKEEC